MAKRSILSAGALTTGTGVVLAAFQTAAAGSAAANVRVTRVEISQSGTTTLEMVRPQFATRDTAGTFTLTSATPVRSDRLGGAASGLTGNTAPAGGVGRSGVASSADSGGTYSNVITLMPFANTAGFLWKPDPNEEIVVPPSTLFVVRLAAAPTGTTGWAITLYLDED